MFDSCYDKENKLKEVPAELWHIQEEDGTLPDKLTEDTLYEVHVMVEDGGEFDLSDTGYLQVHPFWQLYRPVIA